MGKFSKIINFKDDGLIEEILKEMKDKYKIGKSSFIRSAIIEKYQRIEGNKEYENKEI